MLSFETAWPENPVDGAPLIVLLHGRGSNERDLLGLRSHLPANALLVTPRAPFSGMEWGYGPGWAWYRYLGADRPEPESFQSAQAQLEEFLVELQRRIPIQPGPLVLGGFSQGGTMSLAYALRHPGRVPLVLNMSGFLADHPAVEATSETVEGTRFFWGHGTRDPAVSFTLARRGRAALRDAGADLVARDYPMGHAVSPEELRDIREWIEESTGTDAAGEGDGHA